MKNKIDFVAIIETRVRDSNLDKVSKNTFGNWEFRHNNDLNPGGHIWLAWNMENVKVNIIEKKEQCVHCEIKVEDNIPKAFVSFAYGLNGYMERRGLSGDIIWFKSTTNGSPWVVLGDFNALRRKSEKMGGKTR